MSDPPRKRPGRGVQALGWILFALPACACLLIVLARWTWVGDIAASFRPHIGWAALAAVVMLALLRLRLRALAAVLIALFAFVPVLRTLGSPDAAGPRARTFTFATANMLFSSEDHAAVRAWIEREQPDVLAIQELSPGLRRALDDLRDLYPHRLVYPEHAEGAFPLPFGIGLFSRLPVESSRMVFLVESSLPALEIVVRVEDRAWTVRTAHPPSPRRNWAWKLRNAFLDRLGTELRWDDASVLLFDANTSSGSPTFTRLVDVAHLRDSRRGFGFQASWRTDEILPGLRVDLDHVLVGASIGVAERRLSPLPGSDHDAVVARLYWKSGGG